MERLRFSAVPTAVFVIYYMEPTHKKIAIVVVVAEGLNKTPFNGRKYIL